MWGRLICSFVLPIFPPINLDGFGETIKNTSLPSRFLHKVNKIEEPEKRNQPEASELVALFACGRKQQAGKSVGTFSLIDFLPGPRHSPSALRAHRQVVLCIITINRDLQTF